MQLLKSVTNDLLSILTLHKHIKGSPLAMGLGFMGMCACLCVSAHACKNMFRCACVYMHKVYICVCLYDMYCMFMLECAFVCLCVCNV